MRNGNHTNDGGLKTAKPMVLFTLGQVIGFLVMVSVISTIVTYTILKSNIESCSPSVVAPDSSPETPLSQVLTKLETMESTNLQTFRLLETMNMKRDSCTASLGATEHIATASESKTASTRTINFIYGLWDKGPMRDDFAQNIEAWKKLNPAWAVKVWGEKEIKSLWKTKYPDFIDVWKKSRPIQRADIARLMIILTYGGLYADLDTAPTKPIDDIFQVGGYRSVQHSTVLCIEDLKTEEEMKASAKWAIRKGVPEYKTRIANYVFYGKPGSDVYRRTLNIAVNRIRNTPKSMYHVPGKPDLNNPYAIIYTSGPDTLTEGTFEQLPNGKHRQPGNDVLILPEDQCHMNNLATGTWIGDNSAASKLQ